MSLSKKTKLINYIYMPFLILRCIFKTKEFYERELLQFVFEKNFGILKPAQVEFEIQYVLKKIREKVINSYLEIGTWNGGTLFLISQSIKENATLISVDLPNGPFGGGYLWIRIPLFLSFKKKKQKIYLIRENSHNLATYDKVQNILCGKKVDLLFIDGDHSYNGVKQDFFMYSKFVKRDGLIIFHDIAKTTNIESNVTQFWNEIKKNYSYEEIIQNKNQNWAGIGILTKK